MAIPEDLATIARQEADLHLPRFDHDTAWRLGLSLRELAISRKQAIVIDIRRFGQPHQPLFYTALAGTTPDSPRWVRPEMVTQPMIPALSTWRGKLPPCAA